MLNITMLLLFFAALALLVSGTALFSYRWRQHKSQESFRQQAALLRDLDEPDPRKW